MVRGANLRAGELDPRADRRCNGSEKETGKMKKLMVMLMACGLVSSVAYGKDDSKDDCAGQQGRSYEECYCRTYSCTGKPGQAKELCVQACVAQRCATYPGNCTK